MSGPNFTNIPAHFRNIMPSSATEGVNIRPNATLNNIPRAAIEAFAASAQHGAVRGQVVRENKDGSYSVRTKDGEVRVQPQEKAPAQQVHFKAGDPVKLDFPPQDFGVEALTGGGSLVLQISLLSSNALVDQEALLNVRPQETPLSVQVTSSQISTIPAPIAARLDAIPAEELARILASQETRIAIKTSAQAFDLKSETLINTARTELSDTLTSTPRAIQAGEIRSGGTAKTLLLTNEIARPPAPQRSVEISAPVGTGSKPETPTGQLVSAAALTAPTLLAPAPPQAITVERSTAAPQEHSPAENSSKFNLLPQSVQTDLLTFSGATPSNQATLATESLITRAHHAGHSMASVVGHSKDGMPIVSLHTAQNDERMAPPSTQSQSATPTTLPSGASDSQPQLYLLRSPEILPGSLNIGSQIEVVPQSTTSLSMAGTESAAGLTSTNPAAFFLAPGAWPVMNELLQTLQNSAPALAQAMSAVTPNAGHSGTTPAQMMPAAMLFVAAMRGGDIQSWMGGKAVDLLRSAGKGDLLSRLGSEGQALGRMGAEPLSQDWRAMTLPFLEQGEMQKVALYYKHEEQDGEDGNCTKQTRFVFDMALSQMGKVQVDGLFRGAKLDLIVRTTDTLSPDMRQRMRGMYTHALEVSGLSGELSFQNGEKQYFSVAPNVESVQKNL